MAIKHSKLKLSGQRTKWVQGRDVSLKGSPTRINPQEVNAIAKEVTALVDRMNDDLTSQITRLFETSTAKKSIQKTDEVASLGDAGMVSSVAMDASISSLSIALTNKLVAKWTKRFDSFGEQWAASMMKKVEKKSAKDLHKSMEKMSGGLNIDTSQISDKTRDKILASTDQASSLIKSIGSQYSTAVKEAVSRSIVDTSSSFEELQASIQSMLKEKYKTHKNKAFNVAKDQIKKSYTGITASRMQELGAGRYRWRHAGGTKHPRDYHRDVLNGQTFSLDDPPVIDPKTGVKGKPGDLPYCHPADTLVNPTNGIYKIFRRRYTGELLHIVSDNGVVLKATPNHPILTCSGWKAANLINEGDYIFSTLDHGLDTSKADVNNGVTSFVDIFNSIGFFITPSATKIGSTGLEFHGDATNHEVDIININGFLPNEINSESIKDFCEFVLSWADSNSERFGLRNSLESKRVMSIFSASSSILSGLGSVLSLLKCSSAGADKGRLALVSDFNSRFNKPNPDSASGNSEVFRNFQLADAGNIHRHDLICGEFLSLCVNWLSFRDGESCSAEILGERVRMTPDFIGDLLDGPNPIKQSFRVTKVFSSEFCSHVYNLENKSNWYVANGIISHNCNCYMEPVITFGNKKG